MSSDRPIPGFSPRERQLLDFAAQGLTDTAIANKLGISEATVGTYWGRVRIKLGPYSRTELVAIVLRAEQEAALDALRQEHEQMVLQLKERASESEGGLSRELLEHAPDAMILVSSDGLIEFANAAACELFGYDAKEFEGLDLANLVPPRLREKHREHRAEFVSNPLRRQMGSHLDTPAVGKDGREFPIRAALSSIETPHGLTVICAVRPVEGG